MLNQPFQSTTLNQPFQNESFGNQAMSLGGNDQFMGGLNTLLSGIFGNSGGGYGQAQKQLQQMLQQGTQGYQPFVRAGQQAINPFRQGINQMSNPSEFINNIMGQYEQSPWAQFQQGQAQRGANAAAAATGLQGSTVHQNAAADYARGITSQDQNQWLQNNLGVNNSYLSGLMQLMQGGLGAQNGIGNMYGNAMVPSASLAYNQGQGGQNDFMRMLQGGMSILPFLL